MAGIDRRSLLAGTGALAVAATAPAAAQMTCTPPQTLMLDIELLLGHSGTPAKWRGFLAREVTPRFPEGLTVYETSGQWRDPATKKISREKSRVLRMIVPADTARDKIGAVADAYKTQFAQKSVGIVTRQACASF
jgi:hypothetical protein